MGSQSLGTSNLPSRSQFLPPVDSRSPQLLWVDHSTQPRSARSLGTPTRRLGVTIDVPRDLSSARTYSTMDGSQQSMALDPFPSYTVSDLTNYSLSDQRWTLQRKKIGLKRRTRATREKRVRDERSADLNLAFIKSHFRRKECLSREHVDCRYEKRREAEEKMVCHCGLHREEHLPLSQLLHQPHQYSRPQSSIDCFSFHTVTEETIEEMEESRERTGLRMADSLKNAFHFIRNNALLPLNLPTITRTTADPSPSHIGQHNYFSVSNNTNQSVENEMEVKDADGEMSALQNILASDGITTRTAGRNNSRRPPREGGGQYAHQIPNIEGNWSRETHLIDLPTNAYGTITFTNETTGSNKPAKYVRLASDTQMSDILTLLSDYWHLLDPLRPQLIISVTGGAKNFRLDGKKKATFSSGLIKAVKSTNAWILTGGMNVGVMRSVGEAVNQGQYIAKIRRKGFFEEEKEHLVRGIRCLGVVPWGYIRNREHLVNKDPKAFASVRYKVEEEVQHHEPVSLNGDHTHFLLVDDGLRNCYQGIDAFRTELEEAIMENEPVGLGIPVVLLLLEGGLSSLLKCKLALRRRIPVVVVAGTGRGADLLAYAASMTCLTSSGRFVMKKAHKTQLLQRITLTMKELTRPHLRQLCLKHIVECCTHLNMVTIFDINCNEELDRYILFALLTCRSGDGETSLLDQLKLALLWNRPDIAESHIFTAQPTWPSGALEDLMTTALLEEKVEFVHQFVVNGLVMADYLSINTLRHLYNETCRMSPSSHLTRLLQRSSHQQHSYYLVHVHQLLQVMMRQHRDPPYLADTREASSTDPSVGYRTFQDPYQELLLWAILSRRNILAQYLWQRCDSPLSSAVAASSLYKALWTSLGAKNTDIRDEYWANMEEFEKLACDFLQQCHTQDSMNAMGLVERRNAKWGDLDCLELALLGSNRRFVSAPAAQASIEFSWRRGMIRAPYCAVFLANFLPLLIYMRRIFKFQKLGDNRDELTPLQKLMVFYKSPISKFCLHSTVFVVFLLLYSYVVLFDFKYEMTIVEKLLLVWLITYLLDELAEIASEQSSTVGGKISDWSSSVWNRFDLVAISLAFIALGLRLRKQTFIWGRITYSVNTTIFYCRLLRIYHVNYHLGPKLVIFYRMITEVAVFLALLVIFILGYGIASQSLLNINRNHATFSIASIANITKDVLLTPYWQMYGELLLDHLSGVDEDLCHPASCHPATTTTCTHNSTCSTQPDCLCENSKDYSWVVNVMLIFYLIIGNIMLLNLLIAIFTYVFDEVQENSMEIWKYEMFRLIREYDHKPVFIPPFNILEYLWRMSKKLWKLSCRKNRENLDDYMKESLESLKIFEKEAMQTYLAKLDQSEELTIHNNIRRMSEKIDKISKYIDQKEDLEEIEEELEWIMNESKDLKQEQIHLHPTTSNPPTCHQKGKGKEDEEEEEEEEGKEQKANEENNDDDEEEEEEGERLLGVLTDELSNKDIEKELTHLQRRVVESRPCSGVSRMGTATLSRLKTEVLTRRLDSLQQQVQDTRQEVSGLFRELLNKMDKIELTMKTAV